MLRTGSIHAVSERPMAGDGRHAVTIHDQPGGGVLVWAGVLRASALNKPSSDIKAADYSQRQIVSFAAWRDVWDYFENDPDFGSLIDSLRATVEARIASGENAPGPPA